MKTTFTVTPFVIIPPGLINSWNEKVFTDLWDRWSKYSKELEFISSQKMIEQISEEFLLTTQVWDNRNPQISFGIRYGEQILVLRYSKVPGQEKVSVLYKEHVKDFWATF